MHKEGRRAQGLPITTIIIAILGLVVLVILFAITTGRLAIFGRGVSECPGECVDAYLTVRGSEVSVPAGYRTGECDPTLEKQLVGNYIAAGQPPGQKPEEIVKCRRCCMRIG